MLWIMLMNKFVKLNECNLSNFIYVCIKVINEYKTWTNGTKIIDTQILIYDVPQIHVTYIGSKNGSMEKDAQVFWYASLENKSVHCIAAHCNKYKQIMN